MADVFPTRLLRGDGTVVPATLHAALDRPALLAVEAAWGPARVEAERLRLAAGESELEHGHWSWVRKGWSLRRPGTVCVGVACDGDMQGLMMLVTAGRVARLSPDAGEPLVFVDYLEAAPWNLPVPGRRRRFGGVGAGLLQAAVQLSRARGCLGRVGLHSLPQSAGFYAGRCGMTDLGPDAGCDDLEYYEFTPAQAAAFHPGGESP